MQSTRLRYRWQALLMSMSLSRFRGYCNLMELQTAAARLLERERGREEEETEMPTGE